jgi:hypothetical protein
VADVPLIISVEWVLKNSASPENSVEKNATTAPIKIDIIICFQFSLVIIIFIISYYGNNSKNLSTLTSIHPKLSPACLFVVDVLATTQIFRQK